MKKDNGFFLWDGVDTTKLHFPYLFFYICCIHLDECNWKSFSVCGSYVSLCDDPFGVLHYEWMNNVNLTWEMLFQREKYCSSVINIVLVWEILFQREKYCSSVINIVPVWEILLQCVKYCSCVGTIAPAWEILFLREKHCSCVGNIALDWEISPQRENYCSNLYNIIPACKILFQL